MIEEKKEQLEVKILEQVKENDSVVIIEEKKEILQTEDSNKQQITEVDSSEVIDESAQPQE